MDTRTGKLYGQEEVDRMSARDRKFMRYVNPTPEQLARKKVGRNEPCPCGSGEKFKKCCLDSGR